MTKAVKRGKAEVTLRGGVRGIWHLRLYVAGQTGKSMTALANLKRICAERLDESCEVEVIDLLKNPALARSDEIVAIPTLVRAGPGPVRRVLGDLSNTERVLSGLELRPTGEIYANQEHQENQ